MRPFSAFVALCAWTGVLVQLVLSLELGIANGSGVLGGLLSFFGYFTITTNLLVALVVSVPRWRERPVLATTAAAAITVVALTYSALLRNVWDPQGWGLFANVLLHYVTPVLYLLWWYVTVPKQALRFADVPKMLLYLVAYCLYALVRGELTHRYPYPFADVTILGYARAAANTVGILIGFAAIAAAFVALGALQARTRSTGAQSPP